MRERFHWWRRDPIEVPRWMLTAKYFGFVILGVFGAIAGIPSVSLTTWPGYVTPYSILIAVSAGVAMFGSFSRRFEKYERWAALVLASLLSLYAAAAVSLAVQGGANAAGRAAFAVVVVIITMLPSVRAAKLLSRTGLKT